MKRLTIIFLCTYSLFATEVMVLTHDKGEHDFPLSSIGNIEFSNSNLSIKGDDYSYDEIKTISFAEKDVSISSQNIDREKDFSFTGSTKGLQIQSSQTLKGVVKLYNSLGRVLYKKEVILQSKEALNIPFQGIAQGLYIVSLQTEIATINRLIRIQ